jgi:protein SCO1
MILAEMAGKMAAAAMLLTALMLAVPARGQADRRYAVRGMVLRVDAPNKTFVVSHERIEGLMDSMTMPFEVREARQLQGIAPGALVDFVLVVGKDAGYATDMHVRRYETVEQDPLTARRLSLLRRAAGHVPPPIAVGQKVPDFTLTASTKERVALSSLAGQVVAMNFVYTRCALPQFCLRMANTFGVLQKRFSHVLGRELQLLTVTFDPQRDTPEVLARYADQWKADGRGWRFLTGSVAEVQRVCSFFSVEAFPDEGLMNHMVRTVVIGKDGRLLANIEGNQFTPEQLGDLLRSVLEP